MPRRGLTLQWRGFRNGILFFSGLGGVAHQTLLAEQPDPSLLVMFAAMMGLPAFLTRDEEFQPPQETGNGGEKKSANGTRCKQQPRKKAGEE